MTSLLLPIWLILVIAFSLLWLALRSQSKYEIVDAFWAWSIGASAIFIAIYSQGFEGRRWLLAALTGLWAIRLGGFLFWGRVKKGLRDGRYEAMIAAMGNKLDLKMFLFFQIQVVSVILLSVTFVAVASTSHFWNIFDALAILLFIVAIVGQSKADKTLNEFRLKPENKGKVCNEGLWAISRHPNYFFEWLHWLSYVLLSIGSLPQAYVSLVGPVALLILVLKVSGIPLTEAQTLKSRGEAYKQYQKITPAFFPNLTRKRIP